MDSRLPATSIPWSSEERECRAISPRRAALPLWLQTAYHQVTTASR
jgi:hypothetical protein